MKLFIAQNSKFLRVMDVLSSIMYDLRSSNFHHENSINDNKYDMLEGKWNILGMKTDNIEESRNNFALGH